jgi:DNA transformation protein and related proteins
MEKSTSDTRTIAKMRNLGPATEKDLNAAGIYTAEDLKQLGAEAAFVRMVGGRKNAGHSGKCCNAAYLYAIYGATHDVDWRELPEKTKTKFKAFAAELRESGEFA